MKEKKIAYLMNVEWNWIKQRPHFLAQELGRDNRVTVFYPHRYRRSQMQKRNETALHLVPVYGIPFLGRFPKLAGINTALRNFVIRCRIKRQQPDLIYTTFPDQLGAIPKSYRGKVVYDCMDNYPEFSSDPKAQQAICRQEQALLSRAAAVFVSSLRLRENLCRRYGCKENEITLVRNGFNGTRIEPQPKQEDTGYFDICYFGTVSSWFDFDNVLASLKQYPDIRFILYGPAEVPIPNHERLIYRGIVEHAQLYESVRDTDCLIMPFVVNELILAVDPVKLYEYINFNKPIICCRYPEVERFAPFVEFYTDGESFLQAIAAVKSQEAPKYSQQQRIEFLQDNSWSGRAEIIKAVLDF